MPDPVPLDEVYDDETLSLIDAHTARGDIGREGWPAAPAGGEAGDEVEVEEAGPGRVDPSGSPGASRVRRGIGGAVLAGAMIGLADLFEPEPEKQAVIEFVPDAVDRHDRAVEFVFVRGAPARSRIIFRPWLMG